MDRPPVSSVEKKWRLFRAWAGGQNIADEYLGPVPKEDRWQDLSFVVRGPAVVPFIELFRSDWLFASNEDLHLHPEAGCSDFAIS